eukprot:TRINITY_DN100603_c0_g1_i1.p1 TRINITY_DN100603_c0_g1~~TRINITY_DN100603_c0_g1_i1.p1  ORF type:complete len:402 (-),score=79.64 TRINITY_DN100603_c0_g1_i1:81-1286(-)
MAAGVRPAVGAWLRRAGGNDFVFAGCYHGRAQRLAVAAGLRTCSAGSGRWSATEAASGAGTSTSSVAPLPVQPPTLSPLTSDKDGLTEAASGGDLSMPTEAGLPALPSEKARDISYKGPIEDDVAGGARHATAINTMWSNVPNHIRESFKSHSNLDDAPKSAPPVMFDGLLAQAKALVAQTGFAPVSWTRGLGEAASYYGGQIALAPYKKGQTAAYHYPAALVPRVIANRFPMDMYVSPVFQTSDVTQRAKMKPIVLFNALQGKTTLLMIFSGQPLSGLWTGLRQWFEEVGEEFQGLRNTQVYKLHCEEGWFNRRTHQLTKFHLRRQVDESELFSTFVYSGKWKSEYVHNMHLYNKELPVVLLIDPMGYVRWHAVGLPSTEATVLFRSLSRQLAFEKRSHA